MSDLQTRLRSVRHVALDMDGTIYRGGTLFPFTNPFLGQLSRMGVGYSFLTNNSSKSTADYLKHLEKIGIRAGPDQMYTSTQATIEYLRESMPGVKRLFVLGTASMADEIAEAGFVLTEDAASDEPDGVVVGFDMALTYHRLCRAAYWISKGKPYLASHPDRVCPTDEPTVLVDCGSICAALKEAAGREPDAVLGKPDPRMLHGLMRRHGLAATELAMVGDRLYTDVEMARRSGALGVLVLTGEATREDAEKSSAGPDLIVESIAEFGDRLEQSRGAMNRS
jgi:HAD superfamily hydrolase (TIGR01450 family)